MLQALKRIKQFITSVILNNAVAITKLLYGDFWTLRKECISHGGKGWRRALYFAYLEHYGAWIGLKAEISHPIHLPHGLFGIFISNSAKIGKDVVLFQQVCIGSNTIIGSKKNGAPTIEDNVYVGVGAKIIGNITVGRNSRIGANCILVKSTPPNSVSVLKNIETIVRDTELDNTFVANS